MNQDTEFGWGARIQPTKSLRNKWFGIGIEGIIWRSIPCFFSVCLFKWVERHWKFLQGNAVSFSLIRLQILFLEIEVYVSGGSK